MKRIVLMLVAAFLMGGVAMAQHDGRGDGKRPDPKERAERMTERMAKELSLTDAQKQQVLEANVALMEKMDGMPRPPRKPDMKRGDKDAKRDSIDKKKGPDSEKMAEMEAARNAYNTRLQQILTKEQYETYTQKMKERGPGRRGR